MLDEFKKSVNSILYERVSSPLYGTFIFSWCAWNWKILYLTFFISESIILKTSKTTKLDFIIQNCKDYNRLIWLPILSTIILLTIVPFIANAAYWASLIFDNWKLNKKNEVEKKQLLTLEQSMNLRIEIKEREKRFEDIITDEREKIKLLELQISTLKEQITPKNIELDNKNKATDLIEYQNEYNELKKKTKIFQHFDEILKCAKFGWSFENIPQDIVDYYEGIGIIIAEFNKYTLTEKGKSLERIHYVEKFNNKYDL